jgi:two-component system, sensor histidine kinase and response regulator
VTEEGKRSAGSAILLVDDTRANLVAMTALLEELGHPVITAQSGAQAIECLRQHEVALILMDVQMPGLDGFQTVAKIRAEKQWGTIPVVFLTAIHDDPEHEERGYALGAVDYVAKPFRSEVLVAKLRALVSWHERGEQLRREAEELAHERATRSERERVLGIVSHDLRSPLATIRTGADFLLASGLNEDQTKIAHRIERNAERMSRLINDLLDFTRLQGGPLKIRPKEASLGDIVAESIEDLQQSCARRIQLSVETQGSARVDGDRLTQAVANLVLNAVQHSDERAQVAVVLREHEDAFELSVWNEGELRSADQSSIFEPFRRGESSAGMGLGLYITQQIARAHGGDITVSSSPAAGTTFRLTLPVIR